MSLSYYVIFCDVLITWKCGKYVLYSAPVTMSRSGNQTSGLNIIIQVLLITVRQNVRRPWAKVLIKRLECIIPVDTQMHSRGGSAVAMMVFLHATLS